MNEHLDQPANRGLHRTAMASTVPIDLVGIFPLEMGRKVVDRDGNEWVVTGWRTTTVKTTMYYFTQLGQCRSDGPWVYAAVNAETIIKKFPSLIGE